MASGSRIFSDTGTLHNIQFPGINELMFRGTSNPFSQMQFVPERIVEFCTSGEGIRFYKVQWQETWISEHSLLLYPNIVDMFWQNENKQSSNCINTGQLLNNNIPTSRNTQPTTSSNLTQTYSQTPLIAPTNGENLMDKLELHDSILNSLDSETADVNIEATKDTSSQQTVPRQRRDPNLIPNAIANITSKSISACTEDDDNHLKRHPRELNNSQESRMHGETQSDEGNKDASNTDELTDEVSPRKKTKSKSIHLNDGFELLNIENNTASENEIKKCARELLHFYSKRRPRSPTGTGRNLPQTCYFCEKGVSSRKTLREHHLRVHFKNACAFICNICEKRFIFRNELEYHLLTHSDNRDFVCKICGLACKRRGHLHNHMKKHEKESNYHCTVCQHKFNNQTELKEHCLNEHKNETNECKTCKDSLLTSNSVYEHSLIHSGRHDHICQLCNASFKSKSHLTLHENRRHTKSNNYKCPKCDKEFVDIRNLRNHIQLNHAEISQDFKFDYVCTVCGRDFAYKGYLDGHMKKHEDGTFDKKKHDDRTPRKRKGYIGSMSDEALAKLSHNVKKVNSKTGEAKLECKLCSRQFKYLDTMEKHLDQHKAGVKFPPGKKSRLQDRSVPCQSAVCQGSSKANLFKCRFCKTSFKWVSVLQSHMKKCTLNKVPNKKCTVSKGANKRKATLKERLHNDLSSGDEQPPDACKTKRAASLQRKATLKAKQNLHSQITDELSDDEFFSTHLEDLCKIKQPASSHSDTLSDIGFANKVDVPQLDVGSVSLSDENCHTSTST